MQFNVAIVAKPCVPGRVKTRLSPDFTPAQAASLAEASLRRTAAVVQGTPGVHPVLFFDGDELPDWAAGFELVRQPAGDLDERLADLFDQLAGPTLLIGMDTPQVSREDLLRVLSDLQHEAWLGLAPDGGFWAIGMREPDGALIRGVAMSQATTGATQAARLRTRYGTELALLPELEDFDTKVSAQRVAAAIPDSTFAALLSEYSRA